MGNKYLNEFFQLRCSGDLLNAVNPVLNLQKEITEAMAMREIVKSISMGNHNKYDLLDLCSGNALLPALTAFTLPKINNSIAYDKSVRDRNWKSIKNFSYMNIDIFDDEIITEIDGFKKLMPCVLTSIHCCSGLATRIIDIFNKTKNSEYLIMMPCCNGGFDRNIQVLMKNQHYSWCLHLYNLIGCKNKKIIVDNDVMSPRNVIISAKKEI